MRKHYYDRWVIAPMRIHKETKMPSFADQEGKTSIREIYDGDARKQYDAIWHYLLAGEKIPLRSGKVPALAAWSRDLERSPLLSWECALAWSAVPRMEGPISGLGAIFSS